MRAMRRDRLYAAGLRTMRMPTGTMGMSCVVVALRRRRCAARLALGGQRDHCTGDTRDRPHRGFRLRAHAFPGPRFSGVHIDREQHLAVGHDDLGQNIRMDQRHAARRCHLGQTIQNLLLRNAQCVSPDRRTN
jgi:hypothetical protein